MILDHTRFIFSDAGDGRSCSNQTPVARSKSYSVLVSKYPSFKALRLLTPFLFGINYTRRHSVSAVPHELANNAMHTITAGNNVSLADPILERHSDPIPVFDNARYSLACPNFRLVWKALIEDLMEPISFKDPEIISVPDLEL